MEFDQDNVEQVVEEDRFGSLPDELIHKILSCFDTKFAVQTSLLSPRWKLLWASMPCLNFSTYKFGTSPKFVKFVNHVLSHRNHQVEVSSVKLSFKGELNDDFVEKIADYAFSHNVQQLAVRIDPLNELTDYPPCLFSSQSLKHFTFMGCSLKTPLNFSALTTLYVSHAYLWGDLFSKCVNLKNLTLKHFILMGVEVLDIITPQLSNLILFNANDVKVINLIAPRLENLTMINCRIEYFNPPPGLSSFCYRDQNPMQLCKDGFHNLNKATICILMHNPNRAYKEEDARKIINMLQELHSARYLTLCFDIVECISSFPDLLSQHPSPFSNLICLTVDSRMIFASLVRVIEHKIKMSVEARNFFLGNSPNCKFILDIRGAVLSE